jgi:natural product precursor
MSSPLPKLLIAITGPSRRRGQPAAHAGGHDFFMKRMNTLKRASERGLSSQEMSAYTGGDFALCFVQE